MIGELIEEALAAGDRERVGRLRDLRSLLIRARKVGLDATVRQWLSVTDSDIPEALRSRIVRARDREEDFWRARDFAALDQAASEWAGILNDPATQSIPVTETAGLLNEAASVLRQRYAEAGAPDDLDAAVKYLETAYGLVSAGSEDGAAVASNLGDTLRERYQATGAVVDLDRSLDLQSATIEAGRSLAQPGAFSNLATGLIARYLRTGVLRDLDRAVEMAETAVDAATDSGRLPIYLNTLGNAYALRYTILWRATDLERAIEVYRQAVDSSDPASPRRPGRLNNLGHALSLRYHRLRSAADLTLGIAACDEAVAATPTGAPSAVLRQNTLASLLLSRYRLEAQPADLDRSIALLEGALESSGAERSNCQANLGIAYRLRHDLTAAEADATTAVRHFRDACREALRGAVATALRVAPEWGDWAAKRGGWGEAGEAYGYGINAMRQLFRGQVLLQHRETWLREALGLPIKAAYALARAGDGSAAVLSLEQGRTMLLSEMLDLRSLDLRGLRESCLGHLADRYEAAVARWSVLTHAEVANVRIETPSAKLVGDLEVAREELDESIRAVRAVEGYERFLDPPAFADVLRAAEDACLVYVGASPFGGVALVVRAWNGGTVSVVSLPELTDRALAARVEQYWSAYADKFKGRRWLDAIEELTSWLWPVSIGPILEVVGGERVTLVPTGTLALLPLHAAWTGQEPRVYAHDRVTVSYAPSASLLAAARGAAGTPATSILIVQEPLPQSPETPLLPAASTEARAVEAHFEHARVLAHMKASAVAVLNAFPSASVLHFCCHGKADFVTPLRSGLFMSSGEMLTLEELLRSPLRARLVVLSACETGISGERLPDEVIGLPGGLIQAGAAGVVASLWAVPDFSTMLLMARFYRLWRAEGRDPADALRSAQAWVRNSTNREQAAFLRDSMPDPEDPDPARLIRRLEERDPEAREFGHPYFWAAFQYVGA